MDNENGNSINVLNEKILETSSLASNQILLIKKNNAKNLTTAHEKYDELYTRFRIEFKQAIYSSANVLGIRLNYKKDINIAPNVFSINGIFRFLSKCKF